MLSNTHWILFVLLLASCLTGSEETSTVADVDVLVIKRDPATGCWSATTEQWPEEFWGEQASDGCSQDDLELYFQRGGDCYHMSGTCDEWQDDPEVTVCVPPNESCCGSEEC